MIAALHITTHGGKLEGIRSISTSTQVNQHCRERAKNPLSICHYCYAEKLTGYRKSLEKHLLKNTELLTEKILPGRALPYIYEPIFRLEAFGDLVNSTHVVNYFNLCRKNPETTFALWTKNPFYIHQAIKAGHAKPDNLIVIYSSPIIGVAGLTGKLLSRYPFIDKCFTVFTHEQAKSNHINCGGRHCYSCRKCYQHGGPVHINEELKGVKKSVMAWLDTAIEKFRRLLYK